MAGFNATKDYMAKANEVYTQCLTSWWRSLSKEDILSILNDSPEITADTLRKMLDNEQVILCCNTHFDTAQSVADVTFFQKSE